MNSPGEPKWLSERIVLVMHSFAMTEHGGAAGLRDEGLLRSAIARPRQVFAYGDAPTVPALAAAYAVGLIRNHPFVDGNKRVAAIAMLAFLEDNGRMLVAPEPEIAAVFWDLAANNIGEDELAEWIERNSKKRKTTR